MAEDIIARRDDQDELRRLLRELAQELALCDALKFKHAKLIEDIPFHNDAKAKSLADEYQTALSIINDTAAENMNLEIKAMDDFSEQIRAFNDLRADYLIAIALLKRLAEGK